MKKKSKLLSASFGMLALVALAAFAAVAPAASAGEAVLPASEARIKDTGARIENDGWNLWGNGALGDWFNIEKRGRIFLTIKAAGQPAANVFPRVRVLAEDAGGAQVFSKQFTVDSREYKDYRFEFDAEQVTLRIEVEFLNDFAGAGEDRNLLIREIRVSGAKRVTEAPKVEVHTEEAVRRHRMGTLTVLTKPGATVKVTQLRHEFQFGTAISWFMFSESAPESDRNRYMEVLKANFNAAVHENELKWHNTEPVAKGVYTWERADRMLDWCEKNGMTMRGHCIFWASENRVPAWVKELDDAELQKTVERRAREVTARYRGRIHEYDLNNEMLFYNYYRDRLGEGITADMARCAKEGDPDAVLYMNQWGIIEGDGTAKYVEQIRGLLDRKIPIGGIGCQGHFGKRMDIQKVQRDLDTLAQFKLPIKITELDIDTPDEQRKAEELEAFFRVCFGHPAVEGIYMWGFWEGRHWRPRAALWKKDWTPTPAAEVYRRLVYDEWWTRFEGKADASGQCELRAFYGTHLVETGGKEKRVALKKEDGTATVNLDH